MILDHHTPIPSRTLKSSSISPNLARRAHAGCPPARATHSWKDLFIHIVTIVIGLIIAAGLEQTVEWLRLRNLRGRGT
jgi:hypothetical protein